MRPLLVAIAIGLVGCGTQTGPSATPQPTLPQPTATKQPAAFDVALVQSNFTAECQDPITLDELFCQQVKINAITGEGRVLIVPTGLSHISTERAAAVCDQVARAHFDGDTGHDLGYTAIEVLDLDGGSAATCHTA